jgi:hypothetical protein
MQRQKTSQTPQSRGISKIGKERGLCTLGANNTVAICSIAADILQCFVRVVAILLSL